MAKVSFIAWLSALLLLSGQLRVAVAQCPSLDEAVEDADTICSVNNCSSLTCQLPPAFMLSGTVTFVVEECTDPVQANLLLQIEGGSTHQTVFQQSGTVHIGVGRDVSLVMSRNNSFLSLEINYSSANTSASGPIVPLLFLPINASDCMCRSLEDLVVNIMPTAYLGSCATNQNCSGVRCTITIPSEVYYMELIVLPCYSALELVVEDADFNHLYSTIFNESGSRDLLIGGTSIGSNVVIIHGDYSMMISSSVSHPFIGESQIIPLHTIILDKDTCPPPNLTTVAPPFVPMPLPPPYLNSSTVCHGLFEAIRKYYTDPFRCNFYLDSCDLGITCSLSLFVTSYQINITVHPNATQYFNFSLSDESGSSLLEEIEGDEVRVHLPSPDGTFVAFIQTSISDNLKGFQIVLVLMLNGINIFDQLLPHSFVSLTGEPCYNMLSALSDPSTSCTPFGNCSGLRCNILTTNALRTDDVLFVVEKCVDPVVARVSIITQNDTLFQQNLIENSDIYFGGSQYLSVEMSRNATDLNFTAYITDSTQVADSPLPVIPSVLVPLNASACMCASVQHLAAISGHNFIEKECTANKACDGVRCLLGILGTTYYLETIVLPCEDALEIVVEDSDLNEIDSFKFNQSEKRDIVIRNFPLTIGMTLIRRDYSMFLRATVTETIFNEVEVIPPQVIILDRTHCNHRIFPTAPPGTQATPPPPPGPNESKTCNGFYDVIRKTLVQPFTCGFSQSDCEDGIKCQLKILDTSYTIIISVAKLQTSLSLEVRDLGDAVLGKGSSDVVALPKPQWSNLTMTQKYNAQTGIVGLQLDLNVFILSGQARRDVLIAYTEIPLEGAPIVAGTSNTILVISIAVPVFTILIGIIAVMVGVLCCLRKKKHTDLQQPSLELDDLHTYSPASSKLEKSGKGEDGKEVEKLENFF